MAKRHEKKWECYITLISLLFDNTTEGEIYTSHSAAQGGKTHKLALWVYFFGLELAKEGK